MSRRLLLATIAVCTACGRPPQTTAPSRASGPLSSGGDAPRAAPRASTASAGGGGVGEGIEPGRVGNLPASTEVAAGSSDDATAARSDPEIINRTIKAHRTEVLACYQQRRAAEPTLAGKLVVTFRIEADGHVSSAESSDFDAEVSACVVGIIRGLRFEGLSTPVANVNYPFLFSAEP